MQFAEKLNGVDTPLAKWFMDHLVLDKNGNLIATVKSSNGSSHTLTLNHPHKTTRVFSEKQRLQKVKDDLLLLKLKIVDNMVSNVLDQCSEESFFYCWSGLDLQLSGISVKERVRRLDDLLHIFIVKRGYTLLASTWMNTKIKCQMNTSDTRSCFITQRKLIVLSKK